MRNSIERHVDGFGREIENPDDPPSDYTWSDLHGVSIATTRMSSTSTAHCRSSIMVSVIKEEYDQYNYLLEKISARMESAEYPIFVTAGDGRQKLTHIMHNHYLAHCYESCVLPMGRL